MIILILEIHKKFNTVLFYASRLLIRWPIQIWMGGSL